MIQTFILRQVGNDCLIRSQSSIRPGDDSDSSRPLTPQRQAEEESQSSIRPGDDSDPTGLAATAMILAGRNPVFALEMIQTGR